MNKEKSDSANRSKPVVRVTPASRPITKAPSKKAKPLNRESTTAKSRKKRVPARKSPTAKTQRQNPTKPQVSEKVSGHSLSKSKYALPGKKKKQDVGRVIGMQKQLYPPAENVALTSSSPSLGSGPATVATPAMQIVSREEPKAQTPGKAAVNIPDILFEGDEPSPPPMSGFGKKYALGAIVPPVPAANPRDALPIAYGTQKLLLTSRDPHLLYAHWDLTDEQQRQYNSLALHQHLVLRVRAETSTPASPAIEIHLHPESRHWFIPVPNGGRRYRAELGYYQSSGHWILVAASEPTATPPDRISEDKTLELGTVAAEAPAFAQATTAETFAARLGAAPVSERRGITSHDQGRTLHPGLRQTSARQAGSLPFGRAEGESPAAPPRESPSADWTEAQEQALAALIGAATLRQDWLGSLEIAEGARRLPRQRIPSEEIEFPAPSSAELGVSSLPVQSLGQVSSPGAPQKAEERSFWFNINAEIVLYGATEPDAMVTIAGRLLRLRPDGTFSLRFALPDGDYALEAAASSVHGDRRQADLKFRRSTEYKGEVGRHPQDETLKPMPQGAVIQ